MAAQNRQCGATYAVDFKRTEPHALECNLNFFNRSISRFFFPIIAALSSASAAAAGYEIHTLPAYSAFGGMQVFGINNSGQIVGNGRNGTGGKAFLYQAGAYTLIDGPAGAESSSALGITDSGAVLGTYDLGPNVLARPKAFLKTENTYESLSYPGAPYNNVRGISGDGRYVTGYITATTTQPRIGYVLDRSTGEFISTSNETGGFPQGVNNSGVVVGGASSPSPYGGSILKGFTFDTRSGLRTEYSFAGYLATQFRGINNAGTVAGWLIQETDPNRPNDPPLQVGFVGTPTSFETFSVPGASQFSVQAINDAGWVVGNYVLNDEYFAFVATPIPEPQTWMLMLAGIGLVGAVKYRRNRMRSGAGSLEMQSSRP